MTIKLNIGYVATAIAPYYSNEYKVREKSEASLKKLLGNFDVNFIFSRTPAPIGISMSFLTNTGKLSPSLTRLVCPPT